MSTTPEKISTRDGTTLMVRWWKRTGRPRGTVLVVHGLGEHAGRYVKLAMHLTKQGFDCVTYDLRGHGKSEGRRGAVRRADDHLDDLTLVMDVVRRAHPQNRFFLLGHSMGGQIAAQVVARRYRPVDGLILSSPALAVKTNLVQRLQLVIGSALFPGLAVKELHQAQALDFALLVPSPILVPERHLLVCRVQQDLFRVTLWL